MISVMMTLFSGSTTTYDFRFKYSATFKRARIIIALIIYKDRHSFDIDKRARGYQLPSADEDKP